MELTNQDIQAEYEKEGFMKKCILNVLAVLLFLGSAPVLACENGRGLQPGQVRAVFRKEAARQADVFLKNWKTIRSNRIDTDPMVEYCMVDLDHNGRLEILARPESNRGRTPWCWEINETRNGITKCSKKWVRKQMAQQILPWMMPHPETAAGPWTGNNKNLKNMLLDSYAIYAGRKDAFG